MHEDAADVFEFALVTCVMTCAIRNTINLLPHRGSQTHRLRSPRHRGKQY